MIPARPRPDLAAYSTLCLVGAAEVYVATDNAGEIGAIPIDFQQGDQVEQIFERLGQASLRGGDLARREGDARRHLSHRREWIWGARLERSRS